MRMYLHYYKLFSHFRFFSECNMSNKIIALKIKPIPFPYWPRLSGRQLVYYWIWYETSYHHFAITFLKNIGEII